MKRIIFYIFIFCTFCAAHSQSSVTATSVDSLNLQLKKVSGDKWFAPDKGHHFMASAFLTGFSYYAVKQEFGQSQKTANVAAVSVSLSIGLAKEIYDGVSGTGHPSWKDFIIDAAGVACGIFILNVSSQ